MTGHYSDLLLDVCLSIPRDGDGLSGSLPVNDALDD